MHVTSQTLSRRSLVKAAGVATAATALVTTPAATTPAAADTAFAHPGLLHTRTDLARMAAKVKAGAAPWTAGYAKLTANRHAQSSWKANPQTTVYRGDGSPQNYGILYNDIHAAYQNALRHHVSGEQQYADTAVAILNAWSRTLTSVAGSGDRFLAAGLYGYQFANAAELVRDHPDFDLPAARKVLLNVFSPLSESFLTRHNDAVITNYWPNWDLCALACVLATGIFCDDRGRVEKAVEYFKHGAGLGSVRHAIPVVHPDGLAEWLEAGRDQGHALLGVGLMGTICEMAWNQGIDLYGYDDSRFLKGAQYVAKWSLGEPVPYTPNTRKKGAVNGWSGSETATAAAAVDPAMTRPIWAMIANHYTKRRGLSATHLTRIAAKAAPEGGGGDYGPNSGGFDQLGFGTLAFTRERSPRPQTPPSPSATAAGSGPTAAGSDPRPQTQSSGKPDHDLAATGTADILGWLGAASVTAMAGGLLLLRRRDKAARNSAQ
ncbi:alginate lyase family protein [Streptomyces diastatochromogenes]|uniref:alginate lyase family protein n=1 Tax=Streptomyces diastatochromogenes TaxID=42236 RepID=UPI0036C4B290